MKVNDRLNEIIKKKSNIIFSCDVSTMKEFIIFCQFMWPIYMCSEGSYGYY